jgi:hypothetical protein
MMKLNAWIPEPELEAVRQVKGDISTSLFVRRALKKAVIEAVKEQQQESKEDGGVKGPHGHSNTNTYSNAFTPGHHSQEIEVR